MPRQLFFPRFFRHVCAYFFQCLEKELFLVLLMVDAGSDGWFLFGPVRRSRMPKRRIFSLYIRNSAKKKCCFIFFAFFLVPVFYSRGRWGFFPGRGRMGQRSGERRERLVVKISAFLSRFFVFFHTASRASFKDITKIPGIWQAPSVPAERSFPAHFCRHRKTCEGTLDIYFCL